MLAENGCFEHNINYAGNDITTVKFSDYDYSVIKVQKLCQETPECKGFTILTNNDVWLKHTMANRNPAEVYGEEDMISGPDRCVSKYI